MKPITVERLRELLHYDPVTGVFTRRFSTGGKLVGSICGAHQNMGYVQVMIDKGNHLAHRLAWLYVTGSWPAAHIDHIDGNRKNNAFSNLREADRKTNAQNIRKAHRDNRSGLLGVTAHRDRFVALIFVDGHARRLGNFSTAHEAHAAYVAAKRRLHEGCTL